MYYFGEVELAAAKRNDDSSYFGMFSGSLLGALNVGPFYSIVFLGPML
jgi:hypothetical protein